MKMLMIASESGPTVTEIQLQLSMLTKKNVRELEQSDIKCPVLICCNFLIFFFVLVFDSLC